MEQSRVENGKTIRIFNDQMGSRGRVCKFCIVYNGKCYGFEEAEKEKLAIIQIIDQESRGKWSNRTYRVTTKSAKLVVIMRPFEGWTEDMKQCVSHILNIYENRKFGVTEEEALLAFQHLYPEVYENIAKKEKEEDELI